MYFGISINSFYANKPRYCDFTLISTYSQINLVIYKITIFEFSNNGHVYVILVFNLCIVYIIDLL